MKETSEKQQRVLGILLMVGCEFQMALGGDVWELGGIRLVLGGYAWPVGMSPSERAAWDLRLLVAMGKHPGSTYRCGFMGFTWPSLRQVCR